MSPALDALALLLKEELPRELGAQVLWLEDAAQALEAAQLGPAGAQAALHLKAVLGAVLGFARAPDPAALPELKATIAALMAKGLEGAYSALAASFEALSESSPDPRPRRLAQAFAELAQCTAQGRPVRAELREELAALTVSSGSSSAG